MDLIVTLILVISISMFKTSIKDDSSIITMSVVNDAGVVETVNINEDELVIGSNLMLNRVPRAYHKILDELGL